jgi:hypothetical protein
VNADDIIIGGVEAGAAGPGAPLFDTAISGLSFDNVNADQIIIGGAGFFDSSFSGLSFDNVNAAEIVISGIDLPAGALQGAAASIMSILTSDHISFDNVNAGEILIDGIAISLGSESSEPVSLGEGEGTESTRHGRHNDGHEQFHSAHGLGNDEPHRLGGTQEWHERSHGEYSHAEPSSLGYRPHEPAHLAEVHGFEAPEAHHAAFFMPHH